jgi:uncharacterized protein (TIRG00374 family)
MKFWNKFIVIIIGMVGLYVAFLIASDVNTIIKKISNFKIEFIPLILLFVVSAWFTLFARWHLLLKNLDIIIPRKESLTIFLSGFALTILPGKIGELIKSQLIKKKFGISRTKTAPVVIAELLYTLIGIIIVSTFGIWNFELGIYIMSVFAILLIFVFTVISSKKFFNKFFNLAYKIRFIAKFSENLLDSQETITKLTRGKIVFYASALSTLFWLIESIAVYLVLLAFGINSVELLKIIPTYTTSIILGFASFLPLGIGVVEGSLAGFLTLMGIDVSISLTLVIIIRIFTRWISVSVGFIALKLSGGLSETDNSK